MSNNITQREKSVNFIFKFNQATGISSPNRLLLWGHRSLDDNGKYYPLAPQNTNEQLTAYVPYTLPAYQNGLSALIGMQNLGFRVGFGVTDILTFPAPSTATTNDQGHTVLTWNVMPAGFNELLNSNSNVTVSQSANSLSKKTQSIIEEVIHDTINPKVTASEATGIVIEVNNASKYNLVIQTNGLNPFTNLYPVRLTVNTPSQLPNPDKTDEIAMCVYRAFNGINGSLSNQTSPSIPTVSIAFFNPQDNGDAPNPTPVDLSTINEVENVTEASIGLYWDDIPNLAGYVPNTILGNTIIRSKLDPAIKGQVIGYLPAKTQSGFAVELQNVEGVFEAGDAVELVLDASQSPFIIPKYREDFNRFQYVPIPYEIKTLQDFNNPLYANYFSYINSPTKSPNAVYTIGCLGTINSSVQSLPILNCRNAMQVVYSVFRKSFGQPRLTVAELISQAIAIVSTNPVPFLPLDETVLAGIPVSAKPNNQPDPALSPIATSKGWSSIVINSLGQASFARAINGGVTVPGSSNYDVSYYDITVSQILMAWLYSNRFLIAEPRFRVFTTASDLLKNSLISSQQALAVQFESVGMFVGMNLPNPDVPNNQTPLSDFSVTTTTQDGGTLNSNTTIIIRSIILKFNFNVNVSNTVNNVNTQG